MENRIIIRHGEPTKDDKLPFGTSCKIIRPSGDGFDLWIQYSTEEERPRWEFMGTFDNDAHICNHLTDLKL